jgi:hypothetical protein
LHGGPARARRYRIPAFRTSTESFLAPLWSIPMSVDIDISTALIRADRD